MDLIMLVAIYTQIPRSYLGTWDESANMHRSRSRERLMVVTFADVAMGWDDAVASRREKVLGYPELEVAIAIQ